jgi:hypothetical protein
MSMLNVAVGAAASLCEKIASEILDETTIFS